MALNEGGAFCKNCNKSVLTRKKSIGLLEIIVHLFLTVATGGLWLPVVLIRGISSMNSGGWRCTQCGKRLPLFGRRY